MLGCAVARMRGCADARLHGCAVARMCGCPGETICTVVYDYDENYVCVGINATSQEVLSTCEPFGVIA